MLETKSANLKPVPRSLRRHFRISRKLAPSVKLSMGLAGARSLERFGIHSLDLSDSPSPKRNYPPPLHFDGFADFTTESLKLPDYTPATDYIPPAEDQDTFGVTSGHFGSWSPKSDWTDRTMSPQRSLPFYDNAFFVQSPTQTTRLSNRADSEEEVASKAWGTRTLDEGLGRTGLHRKLGARERWISVRR